MTIGDESVDQDYGTTESIVFYELTRVASQRVVESFDKDILADEVTGPFRPGREDFLLFHLIERFMGVDRLLNYS